MNFNHSDESKTPSADFEKKINAARRGIKKYRNALIKLAE
jgi:DNA-directed RNA polymerase specialized sigma54-like protein